MKMCKKCGKESEHPDHYPKMHDDSHPFDDGKQAPVKNELFKRGIIYLTS